MTEVQNKKIGVVTLTAMIIGNMVGSAVYLLPASLAQFGSISILSWVITVFGALILGFVFSRMSILLPEQGGPYAYVRKGLGNVLGFQTAFTYWIFCWVGNAAIVITAVSYLSVFFPILSQSFYALIASIVFVWIFTFINLLGVHQASIVSFIATILKLIPIALVLIFGFFFFHPEYLTNSINVGAPKTSNVSAIVQGIILALWGLVGIESGTVPADSIKHPHRTIPIATILGISVSGFIYIASTIVIMGIIPNEILQKSSSPVAITLQLIFGDVGKWMAVIGAVISCLGCMNGWILLQGQMPMAAADNRLFLKSFAKRSRRGVPAYGLVISSCLITLLLIFTASPQLINQYNRIISVATLSVIISYLYTPVAELSMWRRQAFSLSKKSILCAWLAILFSLLVAISASMQDLAAFSLLLLISIPLYYFAETSHSHN